jgi:hypothetical protein
MSSEQTKRLLLLNRRCQAWPILALISASGNQKNLQGVVREVVHGCPPECYFVTLVRVCGLAGQYLYLRAPDLDCFPEITIERIAPAITYA